MMHIRSIVVDQNQVQKLSFHQSADESTTYQILAVDDAPDNLLLIESLLEDLDEYHLNCVDNGPDALALVKDSPPDLILLDVMMPEMDGYEVTQIIREDNDLPFIPILLLTAHRQAQVVIGLDSGADDFIRKPFQVNELMARIRALLRLKTSIDQQEKIMRQRDDFVARLTHDLRTPIIAANRILDFCRRGTYGDELENIIPHLSGVIENNDQLLHMVNSLLEVHRHEAKRKKLTLVNIELKEVLHSVISQLRPLAEDKAIELSVCCSEKYDQCGQMFIGDRIETHRIFTNLIGNSIKFTHTGVIKVSIDYVPATSVPSVKSKDVEKKLQFFLITVFDTGIGIPPDLLPSIFDRYKSGQHINSGSGLGLNLTRRIVELHSGYIHITSNPQEFTQVEVYLPAKAISESPRV